MKTVATAVMLAMIRVFTNHGTYGICGSVRMRT